jgi:hypothetical protein
MRVSPSLVSLAGIMVLAQPLAANPRQAFLEQPLAPPQHALAPMFGAAPAAEGSRGALPDAGETDQIRLPGDFFPALPPSILDLVQGLDPAPEQVDIFCVLQPLRGKAGARLQFRPEGWTASHQVEPEPWWASIIDPPTLAPDPLTLDVHADSTSQAFWTVTLASSRLVAATLHILVDEQDLAILADLADKAEGPRTFGDWLERLKAKAAAGGLAWVRRLNELTRPLVDGKATRIEGGEATFVRVPAPAAAGR